MGGLFKTRGFAVLAVVIVALSAIAGCGDDDGDTGGGETSAGTAAAGSGEGGSGSGWGGGDSTSGGETGDQPTTKSQYIKTADAICTRAQNGLKGEINSYLRSAEQGSGFESLVTEVFVPQLETELREIQAIEVPEGAEAAAKAIETGLEGMLSHARSNPKEFLASGSSIEKSDQMATKQGFKDCGPLGPLG